jgi:hypothetical protein
MLITYSNLTNANHVLFTAPLLAKSRYEFESAMAQAIARVNGLQALYSSYLTQMLFTVEMKGKREGGCHLMLFVFAHGPLIVEARWVTAAKAR